MARGSGKAAEQQRSRSNWLRRERASQAARSNPRRTIIDVLNEFDDGNGVTADRAYALSERKIEALGTEINGFWEGWQPTPSDELAADPGGPLGGIKNGQVDAQTLLAALLYYPRVVAHDPFHDLFNREKSHLEIIPERPRGLHPDQPFMIVSEHLNGVPNFFEDRRRISNIHVGLRQMLEITRRCRHL